MSVTVRHRRLIEFTFLDSRRLKTVTMSPSTKHAVDKSVDKYKARFLAQRFSQKEKIDYEETLAPVARYTSSQSYTLDSYCDKMETTPI